MPSPTNSPKYAGRPPPKQRLTPLEEKEADLSLNIIAYSRQLDNGSPGEEEGGVVGKELGRKRGSLPIEALAEYWKRRKVTSVVVLSGAGISTLAGIPDFRSPGTGLYDNLQNDLRQVIFSAQSATVLHTGERNPGKFSPTTCHYFLLRQYTQNIDTLERLAGIDPDLIIETHGSFATARCVGCPTNPSRAAPHKSSSDGCRRTYPTSWMQPYIDASSVPRCESCTGLVKPDIVFFGEGLPARFHDLAQRVFDKCDLLVVIGDVQKLCRDAVFKGGCDEGVVKLAELLGWRQESVVLEKRECMKKTPKRRTEEASTGESWCPDCVVADPKIRKTILKIPDSTLVEVPVGSRTQWRTPDNAMRIHPKIKLTVIPTLIEFGKDGSIVARLVEDEAADDAKLGKLISA
ncbi:DHS-like NAD/FAD-binding domain-containing protein [Blyttiomyces helicus]|uniref:DHS-like NAD/FAD-binding domain-containing protein n=1 Tax=Blyttiomyces helicus TaxID=388810 RepID=A0A4P9WHB7_9FUNG|nr:DHS-like NAD/FAD-binding domain-containing protein [Blyttiomyces helicus]|eukprot:RKO91243.1 DHS-like NAD/FAD-binding domain-containing protein [Blyttiomyces helicus]